MGDYPASPDPWPQVALSGRPSVLVIDADAERRRYVVRILRGVGCTTAAFSDLSEAAPVSTGQGYDVLLLSLDSQESNWQGVIRTSRDLRSSPLFVLLEGASSGQVAHALEAGADDCLAAPFAAPDLSARLLRLLRLAWQQRGLAPMDRSATIKIDVTGPRVQVDGEVVRLTKLEYRALWVLAQGRGGLLPFSDIESRVWGTDGRPRRRALRRVIQGLRRKLRCGLPGHPRLLTAPRVGYRLCLADTPKGGQGEPKP